MQIVKSCMARRLLGHAPRALLRRAIPGPERPGGRAGAQDGPLPRGAEWPA
jgi:hypothetical protein